MSESLRLKCYECDSIMRTLVRQAGKRSRCPSCGSPLRIPPRTIFLEFDGKKVRALREPEWDPKRVRAKRERQRHELYRSNQIESLRNEELEESEELRAGPPAADAVPVDTSKVTDGRVAPESALDESLMDLGDVAEVSPADIISRGPLPKLGQSDPRKRKETDSQEAKPGSISGDLHDLDEEALEAFFETHGAPPKGEGQSDEGDEIAELALEEEGESSGRVDYTPSDLELEPFEDDSEPGGSADFHELLDDLAEDDELDV